MSLATSTRGRTPRLDDGSKTHNDANCTQYQGLTHKREHTPMYANTKPLFSPRADTSKIVFFFTSSMSSFLLVKPRIVLTFSLILFLQLSRFYFVMPVSQTNSSPMIVNICTIVDHHECEYFMPPSFLVK